MDAESSDRVKWIGRPLGVRDELSFESHPEAAFGHVRNRGLS